MLSPSNINILSELQRFCLRSGSDCKVSDLVGKNAEIEKKENDE